MFSRESGRSTTDGQKKIPAIGSLYKDAACLGKNVNLIVPQNSFVPNDFFQRKGRNVQGQEEDTHRTAIPNLL